MSVNEPPIIIKKIVKGGHGHHGGSWKVAYADFVTAMMALFIVLWVIGQDKPVKQAIAMYFTDPSLSAEEISIKLAQGADMPSPKEVEEVKVKESRERREERLKKLADKLKAALESAAWKEKLEGQIIIEMTDEGLRIELLDFANAPFFHVGSAAPTDRTRVALKAIASQIRGVKNPIALEGHTDGRPFSTSNGYTNWELSSDRANAARRLLVAGGVPEHRVAAVRGYADTRLRVKSDPFDDRNRRISIVIKLDEEGESESSAPESESQGGEAKASEAKASEAKTPAPSESGHDEQSHPGTAPNSAPVTPPSPGESDREKAHPAPIARTFLRHRDIR